MAARDEKDFTGEATRKTINTVGGVWAENRGRRGDSPRNKNFNDANPFENGGRLSNWGNRTGWDQYYTKKSFRPGRQGGAIIGSDTDYSGQGPKGWKRPDDYIYHDVCETLARSSAVDATDIEVEVNNGCVHLRGQVDTRDMKKQAEWEIEGISGVTDVQNLLTIDRGGIYVQEQ